MKVFNDIVISWNEIKGVYDVQDSKTIFGEIFKDRDSQKYMFWHYGGRGAAGAFTTDCLTNITDLVDRLNREEAINFDDLYGEKEGFIPVAINA